MDDICIIIGMVIVEVNIGDVVYVRVNLDLVVYYKGNIYSILYYKMLFCGW